MRTTPASAQPIKSYRDLAVWQRAMDLAESVYRVTKGFPREERYGLTSQMRRSAVSIPSNIAEGHERKGRAEYARFVSVARASVAELETQVELARRLEYLRDDHCYAVLEAADHVGRMVSNLAGARSPWPRQPA